MATTWRHDLAALAASARPLGQLVGLARVVGVLSHGAGQLFHRRCGFFQRAGLLFGARRQVQVAGGDLLGRGDDGIGAGAHFGDSFQQVVFMSLSAASTMPTSSVDDTGISAVRSPEADLAGQTHCVRQRARDAARQP